MASCVLGFPAINVWLVGEESLSWRPHSRDCWDSLWPHPPFPIPVKFWLVDVFSLGRARSDALCVGLFFHRQTARIASFELFTLSSTERRVMQQTIEEKRRWWEKWSNFLFSLTYSDFLNLFIWIFRHSTKTRNSSSHLKQCLATEMKGNCIIAFEFQKGC